MNSKVCPICGDTFIPKSSRQKYCKKEIELTCPICGDKYTGLCQPENPITCAKPECKKKAAQLGAQKMVKKCRVCGQEFHPESTRQLDCNRPVKRICVICGKEFEAKCSMNDTSKTCSLECLHKYAHRMSEEAYKEETRICELCGKEFHPRTNTQKYCEDTHYRTCVTCGTKFPIDTSKVKTDWPETCSEECANKLRGERNGMKRPEVQQKLRDNYKAKTGYDSPMRNPEVIRKYKNTMLERYGEIPYQKTESYRNKAIRTNKERYGTSWPMQSNSVKEKAQATLYKHYRVKNPSQSKELLERWRKNYIKRTGYTHPSLNPEVQARTKQTNMNKFGVEYAIASKEVREKSRHTMIDKYGVENPGESKEIRNKIDKTNLKKYGNTAFVGSEQGRAALRAYHRNRFNVDYNSQTPGWKITRMIDPSKIGNWMKFLEDPSGYLSSFEEPPTYRQLRQELGVSETTISERVTKLGLQNRIKYTLSNNEDEIVEFLESLGVESITRHRRDLIKPYELDIYLPEYKLAIECDPTATHNSSIPFHDNEYPLSPSYHKMKTDSCEKQGIQLFHIFGYEWTNKQDIIKSMLQNLVHKNSRIMYARHCRVVELMPADCYNFLIANHRQGRAYSSVKLGLIYNNELVSVMTFGKPRSTIGDHNYNWELIRFCNKLGTSVVGGASKLFKYFIDTHEGSIVSFSDRAHTSGKLYQTLGFKQISVAEPGYVWVDSKTDVAYHRINAQKQNIKAFLKDDSIDLSKSERVIMIEHGFVQVFDSGTITWLYD